MGESVLIFRFERTVVVFGGLGKFSWEGRGPEISPRMVSQMILLFFSPEKDYSIIPNFPTLFPRMPRPLALPQYPTAPPPARQR